MAGFNKADIEAELAGLLEDENQIDQELAQYFRVLAGGKSSHGSSLSFESFDISSSLAKIDSYASSFEAMQQDTKKLANQVEDGRILSERLSNVVRRLDNMQIRSQQALAVTEDIINLKDCKVKLIAAIEEKNLTLAVKYIRQAHEIDLKAAKTSDDFEVILSKEKEVKEMVQTAFGAAITDSNIKLVMSLCPLLQTLGLESEARDKFLDFVEKTIFIAVSADASSVEGATDAAVGYAQALSSVFNSAYLIIQQYMPMVIQGMENSLGDIFFIRKLNMKVEQESGQVLKRYMKYRSIKENIAAIKLTASPTKSIAESAAASLNEAQIHSLMDELALLIQYCCKYSKYLKHVCAGAESRPRHITPPSDVSGSSTTTTPAKPVPAGGGPAASNSSSIVPATEASYVSVFTNGPTAFDKMVDELINKYYMEGEQHLMRAGIRQALPRSLDADTETHLDECFFVLQKCALRAVASNNIQAACAVLHNISDLLSSDLLKSATRLLNGACAKIISVMQEHISVYKSNMSSSNSSGEGSEGGPDGAKPQQVASSMGFLGLSLSGSSSAASYSNSADGSGGSGSNTAGIILHDDGGFMLTTSSDRQHTTEEDPYGVQFACSVFGLVNMCARYSERLSKDVSSAGQVVFDDDDNSSSNSGGGSGSSSNKHQQRSSMHSSEADKLRLCQEEFLNAKTSFERALKRGTDKVAATAGSVMKDILFSSLGKGGPAGGIAFDAPDAVFEKQAALNVFPRILTLPLETILNISTFEFNETLKNAMVSAQVDACCEQLEIFISQVRVR